MLGHDPGVGDLFDLQPGGGDQLCHLVVAHPRMASASERQQADQPLPQRRAAAVVVEDQASSGFQAGGQCRDGLCPQRFLGVGEEPEGGDQVKDATCQR